MFAKTIRFCLSAAVVTGLAAAPIAPAFAKSSARKEQEKRTAEIPVCTKKLGTIAIVEPDNNWWTGLGLSSPEAVIKLFVMKSGCFGLVDRNKGLASRNIERALADSGELQRGSNIGRRQVKAADYFIVPDIVTSNRNSATTPFPGPPAASGASVPPRSGTPARCKPRTSASRFSNSFSPAATIGAGGSGGSSISSATRRMSVSL